jgi:hypothetical protein
MLELILLIISILCLFSSAEASVVFLLLAVAVLFYRRRKLEDEVMKLRALLTSLSQNVHREVNENTAKVEKLAKEVAELRASGGNAAEAPAATGRVTKPTEPAAALSEPVQVPPPVHVEPIEKPAPVSPKPEIAKPEIAKPAPPAPSKPEPFVRPSPKPEISVATREVEKAPGPIIPPNPVSPPPTAGPVPPRPSASYQAPSPRIEMRVPTPPPPPKKPWSERLKSVFAFEEVLGKNWAGKAGIVLVVLGMAFLGIYELGATPLGKVVLFLVGSALLLVGGIYLERNERYQLLGRIGIGGGWALLFFTSYAIHHIPAMVVLSSETLDAVLMLTVAVAMAAHTLRYKSQLVTGLAFLLAYSTIAISHDTVYALSAGAALAVGLVIIAVRMQWYELEIFGILSSYINHFYWLYKILGPEGANHHIFPQFYASTAILLVYWTAYRVSYIVRKISTPEQERVSSVAAVLNTLLLGGVMKFQAVHPELAFYGLLILGALEFGLGQLPITRRRRNAFILLSIVGASLMILAVPFKFTGNNVAILWFIGAEAFLAAGIFQKEVLFRRIGLITGILVGLHVLLLDCTRLYQERMLADVPAIAGGILLATCGILFYLNALYVLKKWPDFFTKDFDRITLNAHSYFGAITVTLAAWALFVLDWTAVGWIAVVVALAWFSRYLSSNDLFLQASALGFLTFCRMFAINQHPDQWSGTTIIHIQGRYLSMPIIAIGFYLAAHWIAWKKDSVQVNLRHIFAWLGTTTLGLLTWTEVPYRWQPLAFIGLALLLTEAAHLLKYVPLAWHVHLLTFGAAGHALLYEGPISPGPRHLDEAALVVGILAAAAYWLTKRLNFTATELHRQIRELYTWLGSFLVAWLLWRQFPQPWIAVAWFGLGIALTLVGRRLRLANLSYQEHVLAVGTIFALASFNFTLQVTGYLNLRLLTVTLCAAGFYAISRWAAPANAKYEPISAYLHTWAATGLLAVLAWYEAPNPWLAVIWATFALILAIVSRRWRVREFPWQAHIMAIVAVLRVLLVNLATEEKFHGLSLRLVTTVIVITILYVLSRLIPLAEELRTRGFHYAYTWVATGLLTLLAWYESPTPWLAVIWAAFALTIVAVGRRFQLKELPWQGHVLAVLTVMRSLTVNIYTTDKFHGLSLRLVTMVIVIAILYALSRVAEMSEDLRRREFHHAYTWVASFLAALLMWYELQPISVAVAWALFALVLFELGQLRNIRQIRLQAYTGLLASFIRIFFVNLTAGTTGELFGPRMTTVAPLALIYFFVYSQMKLSEKNEEARWSIDSILAYVGSLTIASLLYFQVPGGWIATAWSVLVFCLLATTLFLDREIFLHQGLLLSIAAFFRGVMHNLFGASYFSDGTWSGRYLELGSAIFVMLAALPIALKLKNKYLPEPKKGKLRNLLAKLSSGPEQVMFFVPILLLTLMLYLKMRAGMVTVAWGLEGVFVILLALAVGERSFRLSGLTLLLLCVGKIMLIDAWQLQPRDRYVTFIILGLALLGVSFLYSKYRETIRQFL